MGSLDRGKMATVVKSSREFVMEENPIRAINYCRKIERSLPSFVYRQSDDSWNEEGGDYSGVYPLKGRERGRMHARSLTKRSGHPNVALTNDPTTLNCNLFGTCLAGLRGHRNNAADGQYLLVSEVGEHALPSFSTSLYPIVQRLKV